MLDLFATLTNPEYEPLGFACMAMLALAGLVVGAYRAREKTPSRDRSNLEDQR